MLNTHFESCQKKTKAHERKNVKNQSPDELQDQNLHFGENFENLEEMDNYEEEFFDEWNESKFDDRDDFLFDYNQGMSSILCTDSYVIDPL